jgi:ribosomal protein L16 Arg81 hydroxylase
MPKLETALDTVTLDAVIGRMLGDLPTFLRENWRKRPFYSQGADAAGAIQYGIEQFLTDMVATQPVPYIAVRAKNGQRVFSTHKTAEELRTAVQDGGVCSMKTSKLWHMEMPESWSDMRGLFASLCRAVAMIYMSPPRSEDVDIFLAGPDSCLGTHFDTTDVFTLQLFGERKWLYEDKLSLEGILELGRDPSWNPAKEIGFREPTREVTLRPGDALYVPGYSVHRVTGVTWSVSLSLGLRAFNEIDVLEHLLENIRLKRYMSYPPFPGFPESLDPEHAEAKMELMRRVRALLTQMEGLALAFLLTPLSLPPHLGGQRPQTATEDVLGMFRSGFATEEAPNS